MFVSKGKIKEQIENQMYEDRDLDKLLETLDKKWCKKLTQEEFRFYKKTILGALLINRAFLRNEFPAYAEQLPGYYQQLLGMSGERSSVMEAIGNYAEHKRGAIKKKGLLLEETDRQMQQLQVEILEAELYLNSDDFYSTFHRFRRNKERKEREKQCNKEACYSWAGVTLSGIALLLSIFFGYSAGRGLQQAEKNLLQNSNYVRAMEFKHASSRLRNASSELEYHPPYTTYVSTGKTSIPIHHPADYPDPTNARRAIYEAIGVVGNEGRIDDNLLEIYNILPEGDELREYLGRHVNDSTFAGERKKLESEISNIDAFQISCMGNVPDYLKDAKTRNQIYLAFALAAGLGAIGLGVYSLNKIYEFIQ